MNARRTLGALACLITLCLPLVVFAGPAPDNDGDGVADVIDNCSTLANAGSLACDDDTDGYGNACDADYNQDGIVNGLDWGTYAGNWQSFGSSVTDHNCDDVTNGLDFGTFLANYLDPVGPSGLACAGTPPCMQRGERRWASWVRLLAEVIESEDRDHQGQRDGRHDEHREAQLSPGRG